MRGECARVDEDVFGPVVRGCLDGLDFTLLFEETILCLLPAVCFILLAVFWRGPQLLRAEKVLRTSTLGLAKQLIYPLVFAAQVVFLAFVCTDHTANTRATIPVTAVTLVTTAFLAATSYLEHCRSPRPSSILTLYLLAAAVLNAARCRTLWYMPSSTGVLASFILTTVLMGIALGLEMSPKDSLVRDTTRPKFAAEEKRGIVERSLITWIFPTFVYGYRNVFSAANLPTVDPRLTACRLDSETVSDVARPLISSIIDRHWHELTKPIIPRLCFTGLTLAQPFLVETSTAWVTGASGATTSQIGGALVGAYVLVYCGLAVTYALYRQEAVRAASALRATLTDFVFQRMANFDSNAELTGSATTLVSADIERIQFGIREIHEVWANLITVAISLFLIERQVGIAMVSALGISLACMAIVLLISMAGSKAQSQWFEATELRVAHVVKILADFKSIKMMGQTSRLLDTLIAARRFEVRQSQRFRAFVIGVATMAQAAVALVPALGFATYVLIRRFGDGEVLDSSTAFGTLTLFSILSSSIGQLVEAVFGSVTAFGCLARIQDVCAKNHMVDTRTKPEGGKSRKSSVSLEDTSASYNEKGDEVISNLTFHAKPGTITRIAGPTACGKSTLLKTILGEMRHVKGRVTVGDEVIGYCDQNPWLDHVSIRDNITGPAPYSAERYANAIRICALDIDLKAIVGGDTSICYGNGAALSGGQKARICLARAIYACPRILVLDDCLSGLDANTEHTVLENLVGAHGFLQINNITTFLVSSSPKPLPKSIGTLTLDLQHQVVVQEAQEKAHVQSDVHAHSPQSSTISERSYGEHEETQDDAQLLPPKTVVHQTDEKYERGGELALYKLFVRIAGPFGLATFAFLLAIFVTAIVYPQIYIQSWVRQTPTTQHDTIGSLVGIYLGLSILALLAFALACVLFTLVISPRVSLAFNESLARALFSAPISFLSTTDRGSITNRFAQDLAVIDQEVPLAFIGTILTVLMLLGQCVTLIIGSHYSGIAIPILLALVYWIQTLYLPTSSQLRILDLESKAPIVSLFVRSIEGLATIRTFGWMPSTQDEARKHIVHAQTPFYLLATAQNTLSLVLDLVTAALAIIVISVSVVTRQPSIGLALFSIVGLGSSIKLLISQWVELETSLGAMRRINEFSENTPREPVAANSGPAPQNWPARGEIVFKKASIGYSADDPPVISDLNLRIEPGWKVGICGRTGSGKSTLMASLLSLVHIGSGSVSIDGTDITTIEPESLRASLTVVPQKSVLMRTDVRTNLSLGSSKTLSDEDMIAALKKHGLYERFQDRQGLDTIIDDDVLSAGEQQIFCIVRAQLQRSPLVLLDEPTSRSDGDVQHIIDSTVLNGFEGSTILYIAHRLEILSKFDRVLVLDQGRIAEFGHPRDLLQDPNSHFASTFSMASTEISN